MSQQVVDQNTFEIQALIQRMNSMVLESEKQSKRIAHLEDQLNECASVISRVFELEKKLSTISTSIQKLNNSSQNLDIFTQKLQRKDQQIEDDVQKLSLKVEGILRVIQPPTQQSKQLISSGVSWATSIKQETRKSYWNSLSIDVYRVTDYEKTVSTIVDRVVSLARQERFAINVNYISNETSSSDVILFPKYCGNSRFESSVAQELVKWAFQNNKKVIFLIFRYGSTTQEVNLSGDFSQCEKFEFYIDNLSEKSLVQGAKTNSLLEALTTCVINQSNTQPSQ